VNYRIWSARGAICFAPVVVAQVVARNWGGWEWWPFWVDDMVAAVLLIVGGYLALDTDTTTNSRLLTGSWFFAVAMMWVSMFRMFFNSVIDDPTPPWLIALMLISLLGSIAGAAASLPSKRPVSSGAKAPPKPRAKPRSKSRPK
jgi:hypothetical protein